MRRIINYDRVDSFLKEFDWNKEINLGCRTGCLISHNSPDLIT